jgi:hypothetical protein
MKLLRYALCILSIFYFFGPVSFDNKVLEPYKLEVMTMIQQHCYPSQYYNPKKQFLYFKQLTDGAIGQCVLNPFYYKIEIDPDYWRHLSEDERYQLLAHELTHCVLLIDHIDNKNDYMYYYMVDIPKDIVKKQLLENIKLRCGR